MASTKGGDYLIKRRALDDTLLAQLLSQKAGQAVQVPNQTQIDKYIAEHPAMFGNRTIYALDRIQFPMPADPASLKALETIHSMQGVAEKLTEMNIRFARGGGQLDSAQVPKAVMDRILALPGWGAVCRPAKWRSDGQCHHRQPCGADCRRRCQAAGGAGDAQRGAVKDA